MMKSKTKKLVIWLSVLVYGLLMIAASVLLDGSNAPPSELKAFVWALLLTLAIMTAILMAASGVFRKPARDYSAAGVKRSLRVSDELLQYLQKGFTNGKRRPPLHKAAIERLAQCGECLPAIVVETAPLLISVYSEELDRAELYRFPSSMLDKYLIVEGSHLVAAAMCPQPGLKKNGKNAGGFQAVILDFVSEDDAKLSQMSVAIPMRKWSKAFIYGESLAKEHPERIRSGDPALIK